MKLRYSLSLCLAAMLALTACNDSTDGEVGSVLPPAPVTEVPASAGVNTTAFVAFVSTAASASSETSEPLGTDAVAVAPTNENEESVTVN